MKLLRSLPVMVLVLVLVSIVGFCTAQQRGALLLVAGSLAALSWYVTEGPRGRILPRWVSNLLVVAVTLGVLADYLVNGGTIPDALGRFAIGLTLVKLYERRTARDHAHLISLSFLLMLIGCLGAAAVGFGIILAVYAGLGLYVLLLFQLYAAQERVAIERRAARPAGEGGPPLLVSIASPTMGRHAALQFRLLAAVIAASGVLLSVVVFVLFPRTYGSGTISSGPWSTAAARTSGYSDVIDLDAGTRITSSSRVVFELNLADGDGNPLERNEPLLLRGAVLDRYREGRWDAAAPGDVTIRSSGGTAQPLTGPSAPEAPRIVQHFRFPSGTETVFGAYVPVAIRTEEPHTLAWSPEIQTMQSIDTQPLDAYTIESALEPPDPLVADLAYRRAAPSPMRGFRRWLRSDGGRRVTEFARSLLEARGLDRPPSRDERWAWNLEAAGVLADALRSDRFVYTLDVSDVVRRDEDPIVDFLFNSRRGHCEFFASALAAMCRSVGIDARVVTGYVVSPRGAEEGTLLVRAANAHAWVEVRSGRFRYTPIDPTPPQILEQTAPAEIDVADRVGWIYERLQGAWSARVVNFDERSQARMIDSFQSVWSRRLSALLEATKDWMARVNRWFSLGFAGYIWLGLVAAVVVIAFIAVLTVTRRHRLVRRTLRLRRIRAAESRRLARQLGFYLDMLNELKRAGRPKPDWQPPLAFAQAMAARDPAAADLVTRISGLYYQSRYDHRPLSGAELTEARALLRQLAAAFRGRR